MKEGSSDIPALKFMIISDYITFNESIAYFNTTLSKFYNFEQVDGLTLRQFFDFFNGGKIDKILGLSVMVDCTNARGKDHECHIIGNIFSFINHCELDREMSEFFEGELLKSSKYSFAPFSLEDVVSTFSSRYRGRDIIKLTKAKTIGFTGKKED